MAETIRSKKTGKNRVKFQITVDESVHLRLMAEKKKQQVGKSYIVETILDKMLPALPEQGDDN